MAYSYQDTVASGDETSRRLISVPFPYINKEHVFVELGGVETSAFTWSSPSAILLNVAPASGVTRRVKRVTPKTALVTFSTGPLSTPDLNTANLQMIYLTQEIADGVADTTGLLETVLGYYATITDAVTAAQQAADDAEVFLAQTETTLADTVTAKEAAEAAAALAASIVNLEAVRVVVAAGSGLAATNAQAALEELSSNRLRFDAAQTLTTPQKAFARANIGAAASGANSDITSLTGLTTPLSGAQGGVPPGQIANFAMSSPPAGWLKANGQAVSRVTYAALFAAIGTTWGAGNGSTTFNVPELRGEFQRGWDDGRGLDAGRVFGSVQTQDIQSHTHPYSDSMVANGAGLANGVAYTGSEWTRTTGPTGGSETRPRNVALLTCIKF